MLGWIFLKIWNIGAQDLADLSKTTVYLNNLQKYWIT